MLEVVDRLDLATEPEVNGAEVVPHEGFRGAVTELPGGDEGVSVGREDVAVPAAGVEVAPDGRGEQPDVLRPAVRRGVHDRRDQVGALGVALFR